MELMSYLNHLFFFFGGDGGVNFLLVLIILCPFQFLKLLLQSTNLGK